jgi:hypothetical protein
LVSNSYAGAFFQIIIGLMGLFGLSSFILACRFGAVGFMFAYLHVFFLYGVVTMF